MAICQICGTVSAQRKRRGWYARRGYVQCQACVYCSTLSIHPRLMEAFRSNSEYGSCVSCMKVRDRAPDIRRTSTVINEERIEASWPGAADEKIRIGSAVKNVHSSGIPHING